MEVDPWLALGVDGHAVGEVEGLEDGVDLVVAIGAPAEDFEALTSGTLQVPVQRTEKGEILNTPVWTGTASDGQRVQGISLCTDWT